jgi:hypothetical protein
MAITWKVSHPERLIIAVGKVPVTAADILHCADEFAESGIGIYRKLFDLTHLSGVLSQADIQLLGRRMADRATGQQFGPIAIVVASDAIAGSARIFQAVAAADRQVQIFRDPYVARVWLDVTAPADQIPKAAAG